jgi:biotin carboxylase
MVIKPCGGAAGYGVYITKNDNMLKKYLNEISSVNFINEDEGFCVQEYASGKEMFLNFCTMNGKHILTDAWTYEKIEYGAKTLHCKAKTSMKMTPMLQKCKEYCIKILNLIKYKWGNTHIELKVSDEGIPQLIEVNFRTMGCHTNVLTPIFFNFSTPELAMLTFLNSPLLSKYAGKDVYNKSQKKVQSFFIINSKKEMTIKKLNIESWCKKNLKSFEGFVAEVKTGDHVKESDNLINIIGEVGL